MRYERRLVEQCGGGDPGVGTLDSPAGRLGANRDLGPFEAEVRTGRHHREPAQVYAKPVDPLAAPMMLKCPPLKLSDRHERDRRHFPSQFGIVAGADGVIFENERNYVGVYDDFGHAAGFAA